jgi:putative colanic acid biosynthesis acetyltransferase WcaF
VNDPGKAVNVGKGLRPPRRSSLARRVAWNLVWVLLYRPSPTPLHGWRRMLLRLFGAEIGAGAHPYPSARIWAPWNLEMGEASCLAPGVDCYSVDRITLGARAIVSQRASLCSATHDHNDPAFPLVTAPISIGADAWVAAEAFIGPGVAIGEGAVVGARTVAMRDVPARTVVAGNPARKIGDRRWRAPRQSR